MIEAENTLIGELGKAVEYVYPETSEKTITTNGEYNASDDNTYGYSKVNVNVQPPAPTLQSKESTPTTSTQIITYDEGYDGLSQVQVNPIPSEYVIPTGTINIITNAIHNIKDYEFANVNIPPTGLNYEEGTYIPTEDTQRPTISFSETHTDMPIFVAIMKLECTQTAGDLGIWYYIDYYKLFNTTTIYGNKTVYGKALMLYTQTTSMGEFTKDFNQPSTSEIEVNYDYPRYYVKPNEFKPGVILTRKATFKKDESYKWIAIWK